MGKGDLPASPTTPNASAAEKSADSKKYLVGTWSVIAAVAVIILGLGVVVEIQNQNQEEDQEGMAEAIADACAQKLRPQDSSIADGVVSANRLSLQEMEIRVKDATGAQVGSIATCEYSFDDENSSIFFVDSIDWRQEVDGTEYAVTYSRETNVLTVRRDWQEASGDEGGQDSAQSCDQAFRAAAAVPLSQDNNSEIRETTWSCGSVDEWWSTLQSYPDVFGVTFYLESEKDLYVGSACLVGKGSPVCNDAERLGLTF